MRRCRRGQVTDGHSDTATRRPPTRTPPARSISFHGLCPPPPSATASARPSSSRASPTRPSTNSRSSSTRAHVRVRRRPVRGRRAAPVHGDHRRPAPSPSRRRQNGRPMRLVTLGAGEAVGEGLLLDDSPHGTSARAMQRTEAYVLTQRRRSREMLKEHPTLYAALVGRAARAISQRLAATDATLVGHGRTARLHRRAHATRARPARRPRRARRRAVRRADAARARELPDHRHRAARVPGAHRGARGGEGSRGARQRRARAARHEHRRRSSCAPRRRSAPAGITSTSSST